jgi:hypothetical protein
MSIARKAGLTAGALLLGLAGPAAAQSVNFDPGTTYNSSGVTNPQATGASMTGMHVTAYFVDGSVSSGIWGDLGGGTHGVSNSFFSITLGSSTDSFFDSWGLANNYAKGMNRLVLEGGAFGGVAFDQAIGFLGLAEGTPGSDIGRDFANCQAGGVLTCLFTYDNWNTTATYRNEVAVPPSGAVGDLYTTLDLQFGNKFTGRHDQLMWLDTDNIGAMQTVTPEPATVLLLASGLAAVGGLGLRRRKQQQSV